MTYVGSVDDSILLTVEYGYGNLSATQSLFYASLSEVLLNLNG